MRRTIVGACFALISLAGLGSASAQVPPGSYLETCRDVRFDGYRLRAFCADTMGQMRRTGLDVDSCRGEIVNQNGQLMCAGDRGFGGPRFGGPPPDERFGGPRPDARFGGPPPGARFGGGLPPGSWRATCRNAGMQGPVLVALCATPNAQWRQTSIDARSCGSIGNRYGQLVCE